MTHEYSEIENNEAATVNSVPQVYMGTAISNERVLLDVTRTNPVLVKGFATPIFSYLKNVLGYVDSDGGDFNLDVRVLCVTPDMWFPKDGVLYQTYNDAKSLISQLSGECAEDIRIDGQGTMAALVLHSILTLDIEPEDKKELVIATLSSLGSMEAINKVIPTISGETEIDMDEVEKVIDVLLDYTQVPTRREKVSHPGRRWFSHFDKITRMISESDRSKVKGKMLVISDLTALEKSLEGNVLDFLFLLTHGKYAGLLVMAALPDFRDLELDVRSLFGDRVSVYPRKITYCDSREEFPLSI